MKEATSDGLRIRQEKQPARVVQARQLRNEIRQEQRAREAQREKTRTRRQVLGYAISLAGVDDLTAEQIVGLILDAKIRMGDSPALRIAAQKRGEAWLTRATQQTHEPSPKT